MANNKYEKSDKAFVEYIKELLKALYDLTDEDLEALAEQIKDKLNELEDEYQNYLDELDDKIQDLADRYSDYNADNDLTDKQMAVLLKGMVRTEYNKANEEFQEYSEELLEKINNMTLDDYKYLNDKAKEFGRELEDNLDNLKFEIYAQLEELCRQFEEFKVDNGLTQKEAIAFVEEALKKKFSKASKAYDKFRTEYLKAKFGINEEEIEYIDKKLEETANYVKNQYKAIASETENMIKCAFDDIKITVPTDGDIINAYTDELLAEIKKKL